MLNESMQSLQNRQQDWQAKLHLSFEQQGRRTIVARKSFLGPLTIQRPLYPEDNVCHIYILHPPGGVVGGDQLEIKIDLSNQCHTLITTPAANKFYRSERKTSVLKQTLNVTSNAILEWLPQETILFDGCHAKIQTQVNLAKGATLIAWDILCLGRPAAGERYITGQTRQNFEIFQSGKRTLTDRLLIEGNGDILSAAWGFDGFPVVGYLVATPASIELRDAVRSLTVFDKQNRLTVTLINDILVCRVMSHHGELAKQKLKQAWDLLRPILTNKKTITPRIWLT